MNGFLLSFKPFLKRLQKYKLEFSILSIAFIITVISVLLYFANNQYEAQADAEISENILSETSSQVMVDIAGAVFYPGVYEATPGARLKDILIQAGGLSADAEREYISRNFNLAKRVMDQEKIYIPSQYEISNGTFTEPQRFLDYTSPLENQNTSVININTATLEQLDSLTGIGKVTADKIIKNRPYKSIEELLNKKILNKNVYENIKNLILL